MLRPLLLCAAALTILHGCATAPPPSPYVPLAPAIRSVVEATYYSPQEFSSERWVTFWNEVENGLRDAETDADARRALRGAAERLGVSHFDLYHAGAKALEASGEGASPVMLTTVADGVAVLTVSGTFGVDRTLEPVVQAFHQIAADAPEALILDLRENSGGDVSSMLLAGHLIERPTPAGLFLSRAWWDTHDAVPPLSEWSSLPLLTSPDMEAFWGPLRERGALVGVVPPMQPRYGGPVYVLTSARTASASEPLVHLLQSTGRATVIGGTTAGAMVSSAFTDLGGGWTLQHPIADYYTPQGTRLDGVGVVPDVEVPPADALGAALSLIAR